MLDPDQARSYLVSLINRDRQTLGLAPVTLDATASLAATPHTEEMVEFGYSSHWGLDGKKPDQRYTEGGGMDADAENGHFEIHQRNSSDDPQFDDAKAPRRLPLTPNPRYARKTLDDIEAEFFGERPPNDGHRKNILEPNHNRVGIALSMASEAGLSRIACTQEFVDHYGSYEPIPRNVRREEAFAVKGTMAAGLHVSTVLLRYEDLPKPMSITDLAQTSSYGPSFAEPTVSFFPEDASAPIATRQTDAGEAFEVRITAGPTWRPGLYYLEIWARKPGATDPITVSRRTMLIGDASTGDLGNSADAASFRWTAWVVDNDPAGVPTPVHSRKGCGAAASADGSHAWAVQFRNDDTDKAYRVIFQLVPQGMSSPSNWPAGAVAVTIGAAGTYTSSPAAAPSITGDCTVAPHLYYTVAQTNAPPPGQ
jgi:hypothetical protein